jgi:hypothetical protein
MFSPALGDKTFHVQQQSLVVAILFGFLVARMEFICCRLCPAHGDVGMVTEKDDVFTRMPRSNASCPR